MADIVFSLFLGFFLVVILRLAIKEVREAQAERKDLHNFRHSIVDSLAKQTDCLEVIADKFIAKELSYVHELRLNYSCLHCQFQEECMADCIAEGTDEFDYLVCENFKEL